MNDPPGPVARPIRFGVFELDTQSRELRKAGVRLNLPEQPLQILEHLLERPGELVNRDELRKRLWPGDTFVDFEHGLNAAVKRLRDVLGDSADSPRFVETVPRRGYRFLAPVERAPNDVGHSPELLVVHQRPRLVWWASAAAVTVLATAALAWTLVPSRAVVAERPPRLVQLSTLSGWSEWPSFSPDGSQVAFTRYSDDVGSIHVQMIGSTESRPLMTGGAMDYSPCWSPDGRRIAFLRRSAGVSRIYLTTPLGGSAVKVSDFPVEAPLSWSPDGRYLAAQRAVTSSAEESALWLIPVDGGDRRAITHTTPPSVHTSPSFSPDGRRLAYASCADSMGGGGCHVEVLSLTSDLVPSASPTVRIAGVVYQIHAIAWTMDGQSLVYDGQVGGSELLRAPADGSRPPSPVEVAGMNAGKPGAARTRDRLAFVRMIYNVDVYRFESGKPVAGVATSSLVDFSPAFSPDGTRIAFCSDRAGRAIWVAAADGSGAHPLTDGPVHGSPHWAPDGRSIVFDSLSPDERWHIRVVDSDGGASRQLTHGAGSQNVPSWSHDGQFIYFSDDRGSGRNIWRVNARDGTEQQITPTGAGMYAIESADGLNLLFQPNDADSPLLAMPLAGGKLTQLVECVSAAKFAASPLGIYYVACDAGSDPRVRVLDPRTGRDRVLGRLNNVASGFNGLTVSPDGRSILYTRESDFSADLMMVENFK